MNQKKKLIKNTIIYAIGNFGTKILSYIMVLVYSYFIEPEELGYYDLIITTVAMFQPIIIFQLNDGVYRFLVDDKEDKKEDILTTGFKVLCVTTGISEIILIGLSFFYKFEYAIWIGLYLVTLIFYLFFQDVIRGMGKSRLYVAIGIVNSMVMLVAEIIGLIVLKLGVLSLLVSKVIAMFISIFILLAYQNELRCVFKRKFDKDIFKDLISYSAPLVPNTICWWVVNSSDRYIILYFLGTVYNGIYSIANKLPTILTTITGIFYLAWQEAAIKEYDSKNRDKFFSDIFQKYFILLFSLCICAIPVTRIVVEIFVAESYKGAWKYTGFLYMASVFNALCSFLGIGYQISKETSRSLATTIFAAILNIVVNIMMIKYIGLQAASFSTFISYLFLFYIRLRHTKRYFIIKINWRCFYSLFILCVVVQILTFRIRNVVYFLLLCFSGVVLMLWINRKLFITFLQQLMRRRKNDRN